MTIRSAVGHRATVEEVFGTSIELADADTSFAFNEIEFAAFCGTGV